MERFVDRPSDRKAEWLLWQICEEGAVPPGVDPVKGLMRAKFLIACAKIGEPQLYDQIRDISFWVEQRICEISEEVAGHNSGVQIVFENQCLWPITDREELAQEMLRIMRNDPPPDDTRLRAAA